MNSTTTNSPVATPRPTRARRIDTSTVVLICLSVVFALLVLLQMLPGSAGVAGAAALDGIGSTMTLPLFVTGAMISVLFIGVVLLRATRRDDD